MKQLPAPQSYERVSKKTSDARLRDQKFGRYKEQNVYKLGKKPIEEAIKMATKAKVITKKV